MPPKVELLLDILGWLGAGGFLVAYAMVSTRRWEGDSLRYQLFNIVGSILLFANTAYYQAYPSAALNLAWLGIALFAIRKAFADLLTRRA